MDSLKIENRNIVYSRLTDEDLSSIKRRLDYFNFNVRDENGLFIELDYVQYTFHVRVLSETLRNFISSLHIYESYENKLLYSKNDLNMLLEYTEYCKELLIICNQIINNVYNTKKLKLNQGMTKKSIINIVLENQEYIIDCYYEMFDEILCILKINNVDEHIKNYYLK